MASNNSKSKPSHAYSSLSVAIVMFLLGTFIIVLLHSHNLTNIIKEKMNIVIELEEENNPEQIITWLNSNNNVRKGSVVQISKSEAITTMSKNLNIAFNANENPFRDIITFNIISSEYSTSKLNKMRSELEKMNGVSSVFYEDLTISNIKSNLNRIAYLILFVGILFVLLAIVIIRNTINLSMYADRWEIKTMELIGAKWGFIKMPYIKTGVLVGFNAFILATVLIFVILGLIYLYVSQVWEIINMIYILIAIISIFLLSIIIPAITTNSAANKYLKQNMDTLYS
ncbi:MAG: FtsX-like permease family protein [Saprospiraceae bacterium]